TSQGPATVSLLIRYGGGVTRLPLNAHRSHPLLVPLADRGAAIANPGRGLVAVQPNSRGGPLVPRAASLLAGACVCDALRRGRGVCCTAWGVWRWQTPRR